MKQTTISRLYQNYLWQCLKRLDPERAHELGILALDIAQRIEWVQSLTYRRCCYVDPVLHTWAGEMFFPNPLGLAPGFDKYARVFWGGVPMLGFGFCQGGGFTARPQKGNPRPRVARCAERRQIKNAMGFNNCGAKKAAKRYRKRQQQGQMIRQGVNIGKNADTPVGDLSKVSDNFVETLMRFVGVADFAIYNITSPNTPGLRLLQSPETVDLLIKRLHHANLQTAIERNTYPLQEGIKVSPDEPDEIYYGFVDAVEKYNLSLIECVNTTTHNEWFGPMTPEFKGGGNSGNSLWYIDRSREVTRFFYQELKKRGLEKKVAIISVGGIRNGEDCYDRILNCGATLCETLSEFIYWGPDFAGCCNRELAHRLKGDGFKNVNEAVGANL